MCRVEIKIFLKAVGVKEIIVNPSGWQPGKPPRIKIKLQSFAGAKNDEAIIGGLQQIEHVAVARIIPCGARIRTGHAPVRIRIDRVTRRLQPRLARIADKIQRRFFEGSLPVKSATMVLSSPAGKPISSTTRTHLPCASRAST